MTDTDRLTDARAAMLAAFRAATEQTPDPIGPHTRLMAVAAILSRPLRLPCPACARGIPADPTGCMCQTDFRAASAESLLLLAATDEHDVLAEGVDRG